MRYDTAEEKAYDFITGGLDGDHTGIDRVPSGQQFRTSCTFKILFHVETDTGMLFDVLLHVGTLIAICAVYYKDIVRLLWRESVS